MISKLCTHSNDRSSTINEMLNALDRYHWRCRDNKDFLSRSFKIKSFKKELFQLFFSENYAKGYNSYDVDIKEKEILYCVATFINFKYLMKLASIANQLKGFNKTVGNIWNVMINRA